MATYRDVYKLTYVRGPSGIIVMFAEELTRANYGSMVARPSPCNTASVWLVLPVVAMLLSKGLHRGR